MGQIAILANGFHTVEVCSSFKDRHCCNSQIQHYAPTRIQPSQNAMRTGKTIPHCLLLRADPERAEDASILKNGDGGFHSQVNSVVVSKVRPKMCEHNAAFCQGVPMTDYPRVFG